jgi:hypothetical protein
MNRGFTLFIAALYLFFTAPTVHSSDGYEFNLNRWRDVKKSEKFTFYENDLADQMMEIRKPTPTGAMNMSVSLDGGNSWNDMSKRANYYVYRYRPATGETMHIIFSWTDENGFSNISDTETSLTFISNN